MEIRKWTFRLVSAIKEETEEIKMKKRILSVVLVTALMLSAFFNIASTSGLSEVLADLKNYATSDAADSSVLSKDRTLSLGSEENPFTILEIVPNKSMATIGYLIPGCEPIDMTELAQDDGTLIGIYESLFAGDSDSAVATVEAQETVTCFVDQVPENYEASELTQDENAKDAFSEFGYFELAEENGVFDCIITDDGYSFSYVGEGSGSYIWVASDSVPEGMTLDTISVYPEFKILDSSTEKDTEDVDLTEEDTDGEESSNDNANNMESAEPEGTDASTDEGDYSNDNSDKTDSTGLEENGNSENISSPDTDNENEDLTKTEATGTDSEGSNSTEKNNTDEKSSDGNSSSENSSNVENGHYWAIRADRRYYTYQAYEITNNDILIKNVFGTTSEEFTSQVITLTPADIKENPEAAKAIVDLADLIVIGGDTENDRMALWNAYNTSEIKLDDTAPTNYQGDNDIPWEVAWEILKRVAGQVTDEEKNTIAPAAIVINQALTMPSGITTSDNNFYKLYLMLTQYGPEAFWKFFADAVENGSYNGNTSWSWTTFTKTANNTDLRLITSLPTEAPIVYDYVYSYSGQNIFTHNTFLNEDMIRRTTDTEDLFAYLDEEQEVAEGTAAKASVSDALRYLLQQKNYKTTLNILELEGCNLFYADQGDWNDYLISLIPWFTGDIEKDVTVTKMATYEFNSNIEDINATYDLIIIGDQQTIVNGLYGYYEISSNTSFGQTSSDYITRSATALGKQIYTNIGGLISSNNSANARYSENDITEKKKNELLNFMNAGHPVVVMSNLYKTTWSSDADTYITTVDPEKVDTSTAIYEIASNKANSKSLFISSCIDRTKLRRAFAEETCQIVFASDASAFPTEYSYLSTEDDPLTNVQYQEKNANGDVVFTYHFMIEGKQTSSYSVHLYIDQNGDGTYDNSQKELEKLDAINAVVGTGEELTGLVVTQDSNGQIIGYDQLAANTYYTVTCKLPDDYQGILPWKLEVQDKENPTIRDNVIKYTAVKTSKATREKINVLQMNLTADMTKEASDSWSMSWYTAFLNFADTSKTVGWKFQKYLSAVDEFDVSITYQKNADWYAKYGAGVKDANGHELTLEERISAWKAELDTYDMLILGFNDLSLFTCDEVFYEGFLYFVEQGKSLIMSHDMVAPGNQAETRSAYFTTYGASLRTLVGQRKRYLTTKGEWSYNTVASNGEDVSLLPNQSNWYNNQKTWTYVNTQVSYYEYFSNISDWSYVKQGTTWDADNLASEYADNANYLHQSGMATKSNQINDRVIDSSLGNTWPDSFNTTTVTIANEGQITNYPYKIDSTITVDLTHTQYFSLDLEAADDGDVVVWYNLTDSSTTNTGYYSSRDGDGANNYYIYNKGNITYTGLGHGVSGNGNGEGMSDDEIKLFVNTMIAAYRYSASNPSIEITNDDVVVSNSDENILYVNSETAMMYASDLTQDQSLKVKFDVLDENEFLKSADRTYTLQFVDENGNVLEAQPIYTVSGNAAQTANTTDNSYSVKKGTEYYFNVPYRDIIASGSKTYWLKLTSTYTNSHNKEVITESTAKITIMQLELFKLD
jgi:hypothetical protein